MRGVEQWHERAEAGGEVEVAGAGGSAIGVPALGMGPGEPAHGGGKVGVSLGPEHEVELVRHHAGGKSPHHVPVARCPGRHTLAGGGGGEDGQTVVGSIQGVVNQVHPRRREADVPSRWLLGPR